jgi:hypothetical protein
LNRLWQRAFEHGVPFGIEACHTAHYWGREIAARVGSP